MLKEEFTLSVVDTLNNEANANYLSDSIAFFINTHTPLWNGDNWADWEDLKPKLLDFVQKYQDNRLLNTIQLDYVGEFTLKVDIELYTYQVLVTIYY